MVDTPFVSEDFQRAFRNQFPSQVSSGRDLHVSDVVVPVVDFTPTASGASLPLNLRFAINNSVTTVTAESSATAELINTTGFYQVYFSFINQNDSSDLSFFLSETATGTNKSVYSVRSGAASGQSDSYNQDFIVYIPAGFVVKYSFSEGSGATARADMSYYQIADVNGNLTNPFGYSPQ
tara:strand:+ start:78 stop:614 length:537 start_codon:yes stop_codon:yes gene_type:complete